ncbi:MAG: SDR family NAD(P)-dependent oxidoreductase [Candidatus Omnitrophota bacterium]
MKRTRIVFIAGIGSDIGRELARRYVRDGWQVTGTYRTAASVTGLKNVRGIKLLRCDISRARDISRAVAAFKRQGGARWDLYICAVGTMEPIGKFFFIDFDAWERSFEANVFGQLRLLHALYDMRFKKSAAVAFFAGGGTNNPMPNYSAYCAAKIMLIKMCELLDDENRDLSVFIVGPGWVRTKIHNQTLANATAAGHGFEKTGSFLRSGNNGTSHDDIYACINWCVDRGKRVAGGRNFSVVHDKWRNGGSGLRKRLIADPCKFKLRRYKNED